MKPHRHQDVVKQEFSRQASQIGSAPSFTDEDTFRGIIEAVGPTYQDTILDVACGTGIVVFHLAKIAKQVVGLDITGEMLQKARKQRHDHGVSNVQFELGEAEVLPFPDNHFDASVCRMSIHHFTNPEKAVLEMARVTRPGGRVVIADIISSDDEQEAQLHNAIERLRDPSHARMLSQDELLSLVSEQKLKVNYTKSWKKKRHFSEWAEVLNAPHRIEPLQVILAALAKANLQAGINLHLDATGEIWFDHHWLLVLANKMEQAE